MRAKKIVVVKAIVFDNQDKLLIVRRSDTAPRRPLEWDLPGGFVDAGEDFQSACLREIKEETNLDINDGSMQLAFTESKYGDFGGELTDVGWLYFVCNASQTDKLKLSYEHDRARWVELSEAQNLIIYDAQLRALQYIEHTK